MPGRVQEVGDPYQDFFAEPPDVMAAVHKLSRYV